MPAKTLWELLSVADGASSAISSPGRNALTYAALRELMAEVQRLLNSRAIGRNDRVAIVLDNGPDMATAFLAIAASATAAPLNPGYRLEEFEFYLSDVNARLLVVEADKASASIAAAHRLGIAVAQLVPGQCAGSFTLVFSDHAPIGQPRLSGAAQAEDIALVLHTSGTTSRPKIVPLTQRNVCVSAANVCASTQLSAADRALNIMPLFHIHGLIAGLLAPLFVGGEVCCTPGFNALKFFGWLGSVHPTWYTAVPTMHQAIAARASQSAAIIKANPLRFIRSSSASLPPQVIRDLEEQFQAPVIESYGMTEAAHQMTSNPLPPAIRRPGTVGLAAGPQVAVLDDAGNPAPTGATGEIAIRGANVTAGYENNPVANSEAFVKGWFRTGDQGILDAAGYLQITGRLKEIINRGGEKISPREVDDVLMDHPAVAQCVTFAMPHAKLGEEVAVAVTMREGAQATEQELRGFIAQRLADFKVPRKVVILEEIPKGATGKLQRIGLAAKLGLV